MASPIPLYYTFGNHMHWVDMEWLWGYHVLPGCVRDMIRLCREAGVKGCVNFDGIGYEKLASEDPEAFAELKAAIQEGMVEVVGGSYGQPYGLFHGGESNVRQRIFGQRTARRLFGVPVKTFWEEEFDFFPQLPQILAGVGVEYASLFFQWTWHTPEIPREDVPVVWWEAPDGSRLLTATRNKLNLHQWPEDMDLTFASMEGSAPSEPTPLIQQWLELMPSPDWMCRSELILPKLRELLEDPRFEVRPVTLGEYLRQCGTGVPPVVSSDVPSEDVHRRKGAFLPHWTQEGATYAVTFRLDDALPKETQAQYAEDRRRLKELSDRGEIKSDALRFEYQRLYSERVEKQLDAGHGACLLREPGAARIVAEALKHFDGDRYRLCAWCVMPNHVHVVVQPLTSNELPKILHSWKSFTAHEINKLAHREGQVWQEEYYDHLIRGNEDLGRQVAYVLSNPESAGLTGWPWVWSLPPEKLHGRDGHGNHGRDARATVPVRRYSMDQVWHGMTLGKNGDNIRRLSREAESSLLSAETLAAVAGLFGRPYAQWDVYPTWELEEAWRELLSAQHHDNDECEGLNGYIGRFSYERSLKLTGHVGRRNLRGVAALLGGVVGTVFESPWMEDRADGDQPFGWPEERYSNRILLYNSLGWPRTLRYALGDEEFSEVTVPAFGWRLCDAGTESFSERAADGAAPVALDDDLMMSDWRPVEFREGVFAAPSFGLRCRRAKKGIRLRHSTADQEYEASGSVDQHRLGLAVRFHLSGVKPDPGLESAIQTEFRLTFRSRIIADQPYGVSEIKPTPKGLKKYPTGDWMTSEQWFEEVHNAFTSLTFADLIDADNPDRGLLICHDGSQQWFLDEETNTVRVVLNAYDPWDEDYFQSEVRAHFLLIPHGPMKNSERWKTAQEFLRPVHRAFFAAESSTGFQPVSNSAFQAEEWSGQDAPTTHRLEGDATFSAVSCDADNVALTAFYRETRDSAKGQDAHAADVLGVDYPYVLRMAELDGEDTEATLTFGATVAAYVRTNLLGEPTGSAAVTPARANEVRLSLRPFEIATIYLDLVEGRKQVRDLDAKREVWATVHRVED